MKTLATGADAPPRTAAELTREKKLRDDPMADVHGPLFVTCKRCGNRIKLSPKSSYDPFHWTKHRERCLRKPVGVARGARSTPKDIYISPVKQSPTSSNSNTDADNVTPPPLTPDDDRPAASDIFRERSPSSPVMGDPVDQSADSAKPAHIPAVERWQTWNWSELRQPIWMTDSDPASASAASDDQEDCEDAFTDAVPVRYPTPRLMLYPGTRNQDAPSLSA
ncbi:hypothetical protein JVU11DRAFT_11244 [Chiua virens]|nr:hypothetical protein JVU11DRAFT_11244 [Chiua virens]